MIKIEHLVKNYGSNCAVDDISFEVKKGEIVGLLGPNGAQIQFFHNSISLGLYPKPHLELFYKKFL